MKDYERVLRGVSGFTSIANCMSGCTSGFYLGPTGACLTCPKGKSGEKGAMQLGDCSRCPFPARCEEGGGCTEGSEGTGCAYCKPGFYEGFGACNSCGDSTGKLVFLVFPLILVLFCAYLWRVAGLDPLVVQENEELMQEEQQVTARRATEMSEGSGAADEGPALAVAEEQRMQKADEETKAVAEGSGAVDEGPVSGDAAAGQASGAGAAAGITRGGEIRIGSVASLLSFVQVSTIAVSFPTIDWPWYLVAFARWLKSFTFINIGGLAAYECQGMTPKEAAVSKFWLMQLWWPSVAVIFACCALAFHFYPKGKREHMLRAHNAVLRRTSYF